MGASHIQEIRPLTGLRGLLALDVVASHYNTMHLPIIERLMAHNVAVDFFFCLSGFILSVVYRAEPGNRLALRRYAVARFARIYPTYLLSLLLTLALCAIWRSNNFAYEAPVRLAREFLAQLLLVGALPVPAFAGFWNVPSWSVSIEVAGYICIFPLLFRFSTGLRRIPPVAWLTIALLAAAIDDVFFRAFFFPAVLGIGGPPPPDGAAWWVATVRGTSMFICGWAAYRGRTALTSRQGAWATDLAALVFVSALLLGSPEVRQRQTLVFLAPVLIAGLSAPGSTVARVLATSPLVGLGRISYSLYLLHVPLLLMAYHCPFMTSGKLVLWGGTLSVALLIATFNTVLFEEPARRLLRAWADPRRESVSNRYRRFQGLQSEELAPDSSRSR